MSRSFRTAPESIIAERRMPRDADGSIRFPRVIEREPAPGDVHPISKKRLERHLANLPIEALYGLKAIEMRARQGTEIGEPFASYTKRDSRIILYSLPMVWRVPFTEPGLQKYVRSRLVSVRRDGKEWVVEWEDKSALSYWFFVEVFVHELGHHFDWRFRTKNSPTRGHQFQELMATNNGFKFQKSYFGKLRKRHAQKGAS